MKKCPKCGSHNVIPILYGKPVFDEELERKLKENKIKLGGCCITEFKPKFFCNSCKKNIGTQPVFRYKEERQDYREVVTQIVFSDGGFFSGSEEYMLKKMPNGSYLFDYRPDFEHPDDIIHREMTEKEWKWVLDRLYCKLFIHEWKKRYVNFGVLDGEQWDLQLKLTHGRERNYYGSNSFPPLWSELKKVFDSLK